MHPYEMRRLIRERRKDVQLNLKQGSIYRTIEQLVRRGLIEEEATEREGRRPERTTYRLTDNGAVFVTEWMRALLATPVHEPTRFLGALTYLARLTPQDVAEQLDRRITPIEADIERMETTMQRLVPVLGRTGFLEYEYQVSVKRAEVEWLRRTRDELLAGTLSWDRDAVVKPREHEE